MHVLHSYALLARVVDMAKNCCASTQSNIFGVLVFKTASTTIATVCWQANSAVLAMHFVFIVQADRKQPVGWCAQLTT